MARTDLKVRELVSKIERGELQLPEMQRQYVWTATKVRDLLDSLYRGYPSGVILAWQSAGRVQTREFAVGAAAGAGSPPLLLLDGQQRLTSLSAVLRGEPLTVRGRKRPVDILFNLDHPDELTFITEVADVAVSDDDVDEADDADDDPLARVGRRAFAVASNSVLALPNWVRVADVFCKTDSQILANAGVTDIRDPQYEKYASRLKALRDIGNYEYRVDILEPTKSYEEVTEIFVRVNSLGAKLRSSDLALAQITAKWTGSLALFTKYQSDVTRRGLQVDLGVLLKTLIAVITSQSRFLTVASLTRVQLEEGWKRATRAFDFAVNFAETNLRLDSTTLLSSPFLLVTTAYWADRRDYTISSEDADSFRDWFLVANAKGRYSRGSSESLLDQDLAVIRGGGGAPELAQRLAQQVGRLAFTPDDLLGRTSRSGAFKTLFLAFRETGARDWATNLEISPKHSGKADKIEFHHVFPKGFLRKVRPDLDAKDVDDLANLAFIGSRTNKEIRDRGPAEYRHDFAPELLAAQHVLFPGGADTPERFEEFMAQRRASLAAALNAFLGITEG